MKKLVVIAFLFLSGIFGLSFINFLGQAQAELPELELQLLNAVIRKDSDFVKKILSKNIILNREITDKALLRAAKDNNINMVKILEMYAGRKAHRKAYKILEKLNKNHPKALEQLYQTLF